MSGSSPASPSADNFLLIDFAKYLQLPDVKRENYQGRTFYHPDKIRSWMSSNASDLLAAVFHTGIPPVSTPQITSVFLVLAVLCHPDIRCGHMIQSFKQHIKDDKYLDMSDMSQIYEDVIEDLKFRHARLPQKFARSGYQGVTREFDKLRWAFFPIPLKLNMVETFSHRLSILPFCSVDVINEKGGTANVQRFRVQVDLVECRGLCDELKPSEHVHGVYGPCYELAVKSYLPEWNDIYQMESQAFRALKDLGGAVKYLGEFHLSGGDTPSHNIMLEWGERDLDEYLVGTLSPVLNTEIIDFWKGFFEIAETLKRIHKLTWEDPGYQRRKFRGWHGDLKPDNILRVHGKYKLADFGFAKFEEDRPGLLATLMVGGTRTYGAPECDAKRMRGTLTPHLQTIDTWSFGCVLSAVATWVVLGSQAYIHYDTIRQYAIQELREQQEKTPRNSAPTCGDAFHDGREVLSAVTDWHKHLRNSARRADTITHLVLDLVDKEMLVSDPNKRLSSHDLCRRLTGILAEAQADYAEALEDANNLLTLSEESPRTLRALLRLDNDAPEVAMPQASVRTSLDIQESSIAVKDTSFRRVKKSEYLEKLVVGKTANRAPVLNDLSAASTGKAIFDSPEPMSAVWEEQPSPLVLQRRDQGTDTTERLRAEIPPSEGSLTLPSNALPSRRTNPTADTSSATSYAAQKTLQVLQGYGPLGIKSMSPRPHEALPQESPRVERPISNAMPAASSVLNDIDSQNIRDQRQSTPVELPSESPRGFVASEEHRKSSAYAAAEIDSPRVSTGNVPTRRSSPLRGRYNPPQDHETSGIYQEYHKQQHIWKERNAFLAFAGISPAADPHLEKFISNRDIIFVVDNAKSMRVHWQHVKTTLLALAMKIGQLDKDGLDLLFTIGKAYNLDAVKDMHKKFTRSMDKVFQKIGEEDFTDMADTLRTLFDAYTSTKKRQTLIILTDGLWLGGNPARDDVETSIRKFIAGLSHKLQKNVKRWFTIQFISFGQDEAALKRLENLDDELGAVEDVVDHKPWHFENVEKMILGSIREDADAATNSSQVTYMSTRASHHG